MKVKTTKGKWFIDSSGSYLMLPVQIEQARKVCDTMKDGRQYTAEIKEYREKRSLNANAYFWVLLTKLAAKLNIPKLELYREFVRGIGNNFYILLVKTSELTAVIESWQHNGLGWIADDLGQCDDEYSHVMFYKGSSTYDTKQMSALIELVVAECKEQEIETKTPDEIARMVSLWEEEDARTNKSYSNF